MGSSLVSSRTASSHSASGASHATSASLHRSKCFIIIAPTDTIAPHPFGHSLGCLRQ